MEAAATAERELSGEKAERIIAAMRASVARRGVVGSTFDHVARDAGVSRGLLHYYFGTKERLVVEVVRRDCAERMDVLTAALGETSNTEDVLAVLVASLRDTMEGDPDFFALLFELLSLGRRNVEVAAELAALYSRSCGVVAEALARKEADGVLVLGAPVDAVASVLFALGDGIAIRRLAEPALDLGPLIDAGLTAARSLLRDAG